MAIFHHIVLMLRIRTHRMYNAIKSTLLKYGQLRLTVMDCGADWVGASRKQNWHKHHFIAYTFFISTFVWYTTTTIDYTVLRYYEV